MAEKECMRVTDYQTGEELFFAGPDEVFRYLCDKQSARTAALVIGVAAMAVVVVLTKSVLYGLMALLMPYLIRDLQRFYGGGVASELVVLVILLLGSVTVVYPLSRFAGEKHWFDEVDVRARAWKQSGKVRN